MDTAFNVFTSVGYWLWKREGDSYEVRLFYPSSNTVISPDQTASYIPSKRALKKYIEMLRNFDYQTIIDRPSSQWSFLKVALVKLSIVTYPVPILQGFGCRLKEIPQHIAQNRSILHTEFFSSEKGSYQTGRVRERQPFLPPALVEESLRERARRRRQDTRLLCIQSSCVFQAFLLFRAIQTGHKRIRQAVSKAKLSKLVQDWIRFSHQTETLELALFYRAQPDGALERWTRVTNLSADEESVLYVGHLSSFRRRLVPGGWKPGEQPRWDVEYIEPFKYHRSDSMQVSCKLVTWGNAYPDLRSLP